MFAYLAYRVRGDKVKHTKNGLRWIGTLLVFVILAACGGAPESTEAPLIQDDQKTATTSPEPETATELVPADFPPREAPDPLNVTISAEEGNSETALILPGAGGSLSVTGADGITYTLNIPPGALFSRQKISMTPLSAVDGLPFENQWALGVLLEPEGLIFLNPAQLIMQLPGGTDTQAVVGFGTYADGEDFHLKPRELGEDSIQIAITRFIAEGAIKIVSEEDF